ncbi:hypothetical protein [Parvularcula maris]|uniref:Uncharacterized protein n=1 Tax=Parvularcula maris TaxID=2965077 RepID=A0A9X2LAU5_9PROT|nr:hypothetical protein [Parvularcula maris]MCQ8186321.1 hypothetical protein [Parvularcula maris]
MAGRDWIKTAVFTLIFLLPAMLNRGAIHFSDLGPYHRGGEMIVTTFAGIVTSPKDAPSSEVQSPASGEPDPSPERDAAAAGEGAASNIKGVRSPYYSLFAYTLSSAAPRLWLLAGAQAAILGFVFAVTARTYSIPMTLAAGAAALSSAGPVASVAGPDIWAGILILAWALLTVPGKTIVPWVRTSLAVLLIASVLFHASHLLLAIGLGVGSVMLLLLVPGWFRSEQRKGLGVAIGGSCAAIAVTVLGGLVAFEEPSIAPKQYPIVLARALADGPAHDYLTEACPDADYVVCELYGEDIPDDVGEFLWGERGVSRIATPEQLGRLRREEGAIIAAAMRRDPLEQIGETFENVVDQSLRFSLKGTEFGLFHRVEPSGELVTDGERNWGEALRRFIALSSGVVWFALGAAGLALVLSGRAEGRSRALLLAAIILGGIAANAIICGALSAPVHRYGARVIWLVPLGAAAIIALTGSLERLASFGRARLQVFLTRRQAT